jgi:hypothetical protein
VKLKRVLSETRQHASPFATVTLASEKAKEDRSDATVSWKGESVVDGEDGEERDNNVIDTTELGVLPHGPTAFSRT